MQQQQGGTDNNNNNNNNNGGDLNFRPTEQELLRQLAATRQSLMTGGSGMHMATGGGSDLSGIGNLDLRRFAPNNNATNSNMFNSNQFSAMNQNMMMAQQQQQQQQQQLFPASIQDRDDQLLLRLLIARRQRQQAALSNHPNPTPPRGAAGGGMPGALANNKHSNENGIPSSSSSVLFRQSGGNPISSSMMFDQQGGPMNMNMNMGMNQAGMNMNMNMAMGIGNYGGGMGLPSSAAGLNVNHMNMNNNTVNMMPGSSSRGFSSLSEQDPANLRGANMSNLLLRGPAQDQQNQAIAGISGMSMDQQRLELSPTRFLALQQGFQGLRGGNQRQQNHPNSNALLRMKGLQDLKKADADTPASKTTTPKKKKRTHKKKPADMPRRPLSAYNLFFSEERERILKELEENEGEETDKSKVKNEKNKDKKIEEDSSSSNDGKKKKKGKEKPRALLQPLLPSEKKRRPHRKTHGKISFQMLAQMVGRRWKALPDNKRKYYQDLAKEDMKRQKQAMEEYYKKQATPDQKQEDCGARSGEPSPKRPKTATVR